MDAVLVRAYLEALPDLPPDARSVERARYALATLQGPDIRYLVATIAGPGAAEVARITAGVLREAGAPAGILGRTLGETWVDGAPIDDALLGQAGTLAAAAGYQLAATATELGEVLRRDAVVVLGLTAFAEASQRVALLLDEAVDPFDPVHAPRPDLFVTTASGPLLDVALGLAPRDRPLVAPAVPANAIGPLEADRTAPVLIQGRDHAVEPRAGRLVFRVRDEEYVAFDPLPGVDERIVAPAIAAALALGAMGIRMREEWVLGALDRLRAQPVAS